jgi:hypothetical protein
MRARLEVPNSALAGEDNFGQPADPRADSCERRRVPGCCISGKRRYLLAAKDCARIGPEWQPVPASANVCQTALSNGKDRHR